MSRPNRSISIVVIIAVVISAWLAWQLQIEKRSLASLQERALQLGVPQAQLPSPAAPAPASGPPAGESPVVASPDPGASADNAPGPDAARALPTLIVMNADGSVDSSPRAGALAYLQLLYGDVEKALGLTPEEMDALLNLIARGTASTPEELDAVTGGKYAQLQDLQRQGTAANRVVALRNSLASSSQPITDIQAGKLQADLLEAHRRLDREMATQPRPAEPRALLEYEDLRRRITDAAYDAAIESARSYLTPQQIAHWQAQLETSSNQERRDRELRRLRLEAGAVEKPKPPGPIYFFPEGIPTRPR